MTEPAMSEKNIKHMDRRHVPINKYSISTIKCLLKIIDKSIYIKIFTNGQ